MTVPFNLSQLAVAAVVVERARREEQEAEDRRYAALRRKQAQFRSLDDEPLLVDEPMTNQQHPITPPPELQEQWYASADDAGEDAIEGVATRAAQWGADQQLEQCVAWLDGYEREGWAAEQMRSCCRPKPPSLKEQALEVLMKADGANHPVPVLVLPPDEAAVIRRALEALPE